ncbi:MULTISPECIES: TilS substrate C-terminal domain-containing protein [unclassified Microcystis]|uniref:TilS substrate C-terminal domain-containing protein n=1 Tax=unclassified Microcystis TaxID=2643300 RepID=UPI00338D3AD3
MLSPLFALLLQESLHPPSPQNRKPHHLKKHLQQYQIPVPLRKRLLLLGDFVALKLPGR